MDLARTGTRPLRRMPVAFWLAVAVSLLPVVHAEDEQTIPRRRPGDHGPVVAPQPLPDPNRGAGLRRLGAAPPSAAPAPVPDRWRLTRDLGLARERWWDGYGRNLLKGDRPLFGRWFSNLNLLSDTRIETGAVPDRVAAARVSGPVRRASLSRTRHAVTETLVLDTRIYRGETVYRPPDFELRIAGALDFRHLDAGTRGITGPSPRAPETRDDLHLALQRFALTTRLRTVSDRFDYDSIAVGLQSFNLDFRGFVLFDEMFGVRLFGTRDGNRLQYNLAWMRRFERDTNSRLNRVGEGLRDEDLWIANLYRLHWPFTGLHSSVAILHHRDRDDEPFIDDNGFMARPGDPGRRPRRSYEVTYLGYSADGRYERVNVSASLYKLFGSESTGVFRADETDVDAWLFAGEFSFDHDWMRFRASMLFASGDGNPLDGDATAFDAPLANPLFAGSDSSYWIRQDVPLLGGRRVSLSPRHGIIPALRADGPHGQANFVNPGLWLAGLGADLDVLPELRVTLDANYLRFADAAALEQAVQGGSIGGAIGWDLSGSIIYRPLFTQNVVVRLSGALLVAGAGLRALQGDDALYAVSANVVLRY